jgi:hypothetical protein
MRRAVFSASESTRRVASLTADACCLNYQRIDPVGAASFRACSTSALASPEFFCFVVSFLTKR